MWTTDDNTGVKFGQMKGFDVNMNMVDRVKEIILDSAEVAKTTAVNVSRYEVAKSLVDQSYKIFQKYVPVPAMVKAFGGDRLLKPVVGFLMGVALKSCMQNNRKAELVSDLLVEGAVTGAVHEINIGGLIDEFIATIPFDQLEKAGVVTNKRTNTAATECNEERWEAPTAAEGTTQD